MRKTVALLVCCFLLAGMLTADAFAAKAGYEFSPEPEAVQTVRSAQIQAAGSSGVFTAALLGIFCFAASVTATVIILKKKK